MLKPIHRVNCSPALAACQQLMRRFALWLCDANVKDTDVTLAKLQTHMGSAIEGEWLWDLVAVDKRSRNKTKALLEKVQEIAKLAEPEKKGLRKWILDVSIIAQHFSSAPPERLPVVPPNRWSATNDSWKAFKALMVAFYNEGFREGLPYQSNGTPTANTSLRVTYEQFVREFREAHRLDPHPDAREVCVLCGGVLVQPAVDHWVAKGAFPLLAVCADNLLPICSECNEAPQKGQKEVHGKNGCFADWFHPYLRHANGTIQPRYDDAAFGIRIDSATQEDAPKVTNLDTLLRLTERWTREFKAEYRRMQREIEKRQPKNGPWTCGDLQQLIVAYRDTLSPAEPHHEIHQQVAAALLAPARLMAFVQTIP